jgi:SAM-dependent methyltransferase
MRRVGSVSCAEGRLARMKMRDLARTVRIAYVHAFFLAVCLLLSVFLLYSWYDFRRRIRKKPFERSLFVRLTDRPFFYELFHKFSVFPLFSDIYRYVPRLSGRVLQVGCGTGYFNEYVRRRYKSGIPELYNLDVNRRYLEYGVKKGRFERFVQASIASTPFEDAFFDVILFPRSLHHIQRLKTALGECSRVLKPKGKIVIFDPIRHERGGATRDYSAMNSYVDGVIHYYTERGLVDLVTSKMPADVRVVGVSTVDPIVAMNHNLLISNRDCVLILEKREGSGREQ